MPEEDERLLIRHADEYLTERYGVVVDDVVLRTWGNGQAELTLGPFSVRFCEVPHYTVTYAVELAVNGGRRLTFSSDCSPNHELTKFARDTDMLLIEATLPRPERTGERGHLTPREAGQLGRSAHAKRLVITHFSDELDAGWFRSEAVGGYGADVELAEEGAVYTV